MVTSAFGHWRPVVAIILGARLATDSQSMNSLATGGDQCLGWLSASDGQRVGTGDPLTVYTGDEWRPLVATGLVRPTIGDQPQRSGDQWRSQVTGKLRRPVQRRAYYRGMRLVPATPINR